MSGMTGNDLYERIGKLREEHGDLPVYIWADHGQWAEAAYYVQVAYVCDTDLIADEDVDEYEPEDLTKVILVS